MRRNDLSCFRIRTEIGPIISSRRLYRQLSTMTRTIVVIWRSPGPTNLAYNTTPYEKSICKVSVGNQSWRALQQQRKLQPTSTRLVNASEQPMDLKGKINIKIKIADMELNSMCHVVKHLAHPIIIGIDFLRKYNVNIDFEHNRVVVGRKDVCLPPEEIIRIHYTLMW